MDKMSAGLRERLAGAPGQAVDLIVRTHGDPEPFTARLEELGFSIRHRFALLPGLAITGAAGHVSSLLDEDWIVSVEEDRPVTALSQEVE